MLLKGVLYDCCQTAWTTIYVLSRALPPQLRLSARPEVSLWCALRRSKRLSAYAE